MNASSNSSSRRRERPPPPRRPTRSMPTTTTTTATTKLATNPHAPPANRPRLHTTNKSTHTVARETQPSPDASIPHHTVPEQQRLPPSATREGAAGLARTQSCFSTRVACRSQWAPHEPSHTSRVSRSIVSHDIGAPNTPTARCHTRALKQRRENSRALALAHGQDPAGSGDHVAQPASQRMGLGARPEARVGPHIDREGVQPLYNILGLVWGSRVRTGGGKDF